jgi:glycosyltransferase involved in cell wall biosynthesis
MNVTVSVFGRFHAFNLAHELDARGHLHCLITTYPGRIAEQYGVPRERTRAFPAPEIAQRLWRHAPHSLASRYDPSPWLHARFEQAAARRIPEGTEVYVGWSGFSELGLRRARALGAVTIVERGSTHIAWQRDMLLEEYDRFGIRGEVPHPAVVEKEEAEYVLADYISVPSQFARKTFEERGTSSSRLLQVPYGVDLGGFYPTHKTDTIFRVLFVGTLSLRKGVQYLLPAVKRLHRPDVELWLVGARQHETESLLARYTSHLRHVAPVPQKQLVNYYGRASVFVLASLEEGFAMVVPQAMACGLPIICTANTGAADLVTRVRCGFVVPTRDVDALTERLTYLYEHPDVALEMGRRGREAVQSGLTWHDYGTSIVREYERVLRAPPQEMQPAPASGGVRPTRGPAR